MLANGLALWKGGGVGFPAKMPLDGRFAESTKKF